MAVPAIVYVGTGDMITAGTIEQGNGVYKSNDAGKSWQHLGLDRTKHIPSISVDPRSADVVLLAAAGDPHRKSEDRGIFRSTNGGRNWTRVLYADDETGGQFVTRAHDRPNVVFATTVRYYVPDGLSDRQAVLVREPNCSKLGRARPLSPSSNRPDGSAPWF